MITLARSCPRGFLPHLAAGRARRRSRPGIAALAAVLASLATWPSPAAAQMPGLPVLQNAFAYPAIAVAANVGYSKDVLTLAGAATWVPSSARYIVSGGAGLVSPEEGDENGFAAGARVAAPLRTFLDDALGVAAFAGAGGAWFEAFDAVNAAAGLGIGWRRAFGVGRGVSLHTAPHVRWVRNSLGDGSSSSAWLFRISAGVDLTITPSIGATIGVEAGSTSDESAPLMARTIAGAGLSYIFFR